jgi:hypothetical protein
MEPPVYCVWPERPLPPGRRDVRPSWDPPLPLLTPVKMMSREATVHTRVHFLNCTTGQVRRGSLLPPQHLPAPQKERAWREWSWWAHRWKGPCLQTTLGATS